MHISLIWAMASNRVIGRGNTLPWRLPTDMQNFMVTTMGKPVLMGRKTFESMKAPLPGRTNIVLTSDVAYNRPGIRVVHNFAQGLELARDQCLIDGVDELFVVGGAGVYELGLQVATRLYVTHVDAAPQGDTFFPEINWDDWRVLQRQHYPADQKNVYAFDIALYERASTPA